MTTITIPASFDEAREKLQGIHALLTATHWERCAILAAYVRLSDHGGDRKSEAIKAKSSLDPRKFAALGIAGLKSKDTVRKYVQVFLDTFGRYPEPGEAIDLDSLGSFKDALEKAKRPTFRPAEGPVTTVNDLSSDPATAQMEATVAMIDAGLDAETAFAIGDQITPEFLDHERENIASSDRIAEKKREFDRAHGYPNRIMRALQEAATIAKEWQDSPLFREQLAKGDSAWLERTKREVGYTCSVILDLIDGKKVDEYGRTD